MAPFIGATGNPTTLAETVFSTIPGSPVYASKASQYTKRRQRARHTERGPPGPQRPPGPLPLRGLTGTTMFAAATSAAPSATGRSSALRSPRWRRRPGCRCGCGRRRRTVGTCTTTAAGPVPLEAGALRSRLGADDRRDDAAVEHPARADVRRARRPAPPAGPARRPAARRLPRRLGGVRAGGLGRSTVGSMPRSTRCPWLADHPQLILGATLLVAGLWQFSPLRDRCLEECRSPLGFVVNRWRGTRRAARGVAMGIAHGPFCIGCCWSLMLVMFGVGLGSLVPCSRSARSPRSRRTRRGDGA